MKIKLFSRTMFIALCASASLLFVSCDKDDDDDDNDDGMFTLSGDASGAQEVPVVNTTATGTITGTYNENTNQLQYAISWTGLSGDITVAHFHGPASPGEDADPVVDISIGTNGVSGSTSATITLTDVVEDQLLDGKLYYNLHTALYPGGEIRGQVKADD